MSQPGAVEGGVKASSSNDVIIYHQTFLMMRGRRMVRPYTMIFWGDTIYHIIFVISYMSSSHLLSMSYVV